MIQNLEVPPAGPGTLARLDHLGLLALTGEDTISFLHGQLTNDVAGLAEGVARIAGYCSAKGRLLAIFLLWRAGGTVYLAMPRELAGPLAKRLSLFVLRARVRIADVSDERILYGLTGSPELIGRLRSLQAPSAPWNPPAVVYGHAELQMGTFIMLPPVGQEQRWLIATDSDRAARLESALDAVPRADSAHWRWLEIQAGMPSISAKTQDRFVPQMLNLEAVGGIDFKKGCYPGQEVVARSQYLGKVKRRTTRAHAATGVLPAPGGDVFQLGRLNEAIGTVVSAEAAPGGGIDLLIELPLDATQDGALHLGTPDGPQLELRELPYPLPQNEIFVRPRL